MWDEFTYLFMNFNDTVVEFWEWKITLSYTLVRMLLLISAGIELIRVSKREHGR